MLGTNEARRTGDRECRRTSDRNLRRTSDPNAVVDTGPIRVNERIHRQPQGTLRKSRKRDSSRCKALGTGRRGFARHLGHLGHAPATKNCRPGRPLRRKKPSGAVAFLAWPTLPSRRWRPNSVERTAKSIRSSFGTHGRRLGAGSATRPRSALAAKAALSRNIVQGGESLVSSGVPPVIIQSS